MTARYRVTPRAKRDLVEIARYTLKTWGAERRDAYLGDLERRFAWLSENPRLGRRRDDVAPGYLSFPQGAHVIFYVVRGDAIDIIGVPHGAMDVGPVVEED